MIDKETEEILQKCIQNAENYPQVLRDMLEKCSQDEEDVLRSQIKLLIEEGYLSKIQWASNLPYYGRIEQKGRMYFINKEKQRKLEMKKTVVEWVRYGITTIIALAALIISIIK